jgi:hypothetical protein
LILFSSYFTLLYFFTCAENWPHQQPVLCGRWAGYLANGALAAGLFDIFENAGMLISLNGQRTDVVAVLTFICSVLKWALAFMAVLYLLIAGPFILFKNSAKTSPKPL